MNIYSKVFRGSKMKVPFKGSSHAIFLIFYEENDSFSQKIITKIGFEPSVGMI